MFIPWLLLLLGLACAGLGGEVFVRGTVGIARAMRIPPGIIAATVAAFATSSPELTVALNSSLEGAPEISLGDALGSNVANVALILGCALLIAPLSAPRSAVRRDFPIATAAPVGVGLLLLDGRLGRLDAAVLLLAFGAWLTAVVLEIRGERSAAPRVLGEAQPRRALVESVVGLLLLVAAGRFIVTGATGIALGFGLSEFMIGATVVAVGTSAPELATTLISRIRGHDEVGLGTILGSNIFNTLFIVGVASSVHPIEVPLRSLAAPMIAGLAAMAIGFPPRSGVMDRWRGGILLAIFVAYTVAVLQSPGHAPR